MYATLLFLSGCCPDQFGSADWSLREATERRLRSAGLLAVPALVVAAASAEPEIRERANRLLAPWRLLAMELRAADVLLGPWMPDTFTFWRDHQLRRRVHRFADINWPLENRNAPWLHPDWDPDTWGFFSAPPWERCMARLARCRNLLGARAGWPID
jgi:hypothetical protein